MIENKFIHTKNIHRGGSPSAQFDLRQSFILYLLSGYSFIEIQNMND